MTDEHNCHSESHSVSADVPMRISKKNLSEIEEAAMGLVLSAFTESREEVMRVHNFDPTTWSPTDEPLRRICDAAIEGAIFPLMHAVAHTNNPKEAMQSTMSGLLMTAFFAGKQYEIKNPTRKEK